MPRRVRDLIRDLEKAGFVNRGGRGSHRNFKHIDGLRITICGKSGDEANPYQEKAVAEVLKEVGK